MIVVRYHRCDCLNDGKLRYSNNPDMSVIPAPDAVSNWTRVVLRVVGQAQKRMNSGQAGKESGNTMTPKEYYQSVVQAPEVWGNVHLKEGYPAGKTQLQADSAPFSPAGGFCGVMTICLRCRFAKKTVAPPLRHIFLMGFCMVNSLLQLMAKNEVATSAPRQATGSFISLPESAAPL